MTDDSYDFVGDGLRWLGFDCECRPLSWYAGDFVTRELTAIAWRFLDQKRTSVTLLGVESPERMLERFVEAYDEADAVTGHFIRGFDLAVVNSALIEYGMPVLGDKLTHDTKLDLVKRSGMSVSQENLAAILSLEAPKVGMNQADWRDANRLTKSGIARTRKRVVSDVNQQIELRARLLDQGLLKPPSVWTSRPQGGSRYHA